MKSMFWKLCIVSLSLAGGFLWQIPESLGAIPEKEAKGEDLLISSFESDDDLARLEVSEGVKIERAAGHVSHGKYSLKITFSGTSLQFLNTVDIPSIDLPSERLFYLRINYPDLPTRDFSRYEYLEMDVYHEGPGGTPNLDYPYFEHHVGRIDLRDSKGNWRPSWVPIIVYPYKNEGRVQLPLFFGPGLISEKNKFSFSDVATIQITMPKPQKEWVIYIDDMRLIPPAPPVNAYVKPLPPTLPASLKDIARFKTLSVLWIGEGRIGDLVKEYPTLEVLQKNAVRLKIGIPTSLDDLKGYDIVLLDNFPKDRILSSLGLIKEYFDKGGSVIMFGGVNSFAGDYGMSSYQNTPMEEILPVRFIRPGMYKQFLHYTHYVNLSIEKPEHPLISGLDWMKGFRFVIPDGNPESPAGYSRFIETKEGAETLVIDLNGDVPIVAVGKRSLIFNLEPRLRKYYFPYDFWERFIIQAFSYITKDKKQEGVILTKMDLPSAVNVDSNVIKGRIYPVNLGMSPANISVRIDIYSLPDRAEMFEKEIELRIKPDDMNGFNFSIPVHGLNIGNYEISAKIDKPQISVLSEELEVKPALSLKNFLAEVVLVKGEDMNLGAKIKNISDKPARGRIEVWLEDSEKKLKNLSKKEVTIRAQAEEEIRYKFQIDVTEGRYKICSYLYSGDMLLAMAEDEIRVMGESIPVLKRDVDVRVQGVHFLDGDTFPLTPSLSIEDDTGLKRGSELSTELSPCFLTWGERVGYPQSWENYITSLHNLYKNKVPFVINSFNFWAGRSNYELIVNGLKRQVQLAYEIAGEYFVGIRLSESEAIPWQFIRYREQETSEGRADAFSGIIKQLVKDIGLPEDKLLLLDVSTPIPYDWLFASGADVVGQASPVPITPVTLSQSTLRGMARSFNKWWEWEIVRWPFSDKPKVLLPYHPKTGRPTSELQEVDNLFWQQDSRETHKMYISTYYNGARMINAFSEDPKKGTSKEAILKFTEFAKTSPRCEDIITPIAVVRGKGCSSVLPVEPPFGMVTKKWERYYETEDDFLYLNLFFPNFSDDGTTTKYWWTGTPYGAVDIIYPEMKLEGLKRYSTLIFLGRNRMDSVRPDFLNDLMRYVNGGGVMVISIDQLKGLDDRLDVRRLERLLGIRIGSEIFSELMKKKTRIEDYIETMNEAGFGFKKERYFLTPQVQRPEGEPGWVYEVMPDGGKILAADSKGTPVLILNRYGNGYVFLFTAPRISIIEPAGDNPFVRDVIERAARHKPLPISIRPANSEVQFLISKTGESEATIFLMNHGEKRWEGEIRVNLKAAGLDTEIGRIVTGSLGTGYEVKKITPNAVKEGDNLIISGIELKGDTSGFISYRQASFAVVRLKR